MNAQRSAPGRTGRPPRTSREEVLSAARTIIDRDGWEKLTVRRLAGEIGVSAMTVYNHVEDRADLMVQLVDDHLARASRPDLPDDPRGRIVATGVAARESLASQPWIAEVLSTDGFLSRLGDSSVWLVEAIVAAALDAGCTPERAILVFRNVWYFMVGEIMVRANTRTRRATAGARAPSILIAGADPAISNHDASALPALAVVADQWVEVAGRDTFAEGLAALVDGLLAALAS